MPTTRQFLRGMTKSLEEAIRAYSQFLIDLPLLTTTDEIEYAEKEVHELLSRHGKEVRYNEQPVIQLLELLADRYAKRRILEKGIDPYSQEPIDLEGSHYSF